MILLVGMDGLDAPYASKIARRGKEYVNTVLGCIGFPGMIMAPTPAKRSAAYYTEVEASVGLWGSMKVGFNPGELVDALLGVFGIDIYSDDVEAE